MAAKGRSLSGERNPARKLDGRSVEEIRSLYRAGGMTQEAIGARFGIRQSQVSNIVLGIQWMS